MASRAALRHKIGFRPTSSACCFSIQFLLMVVSAVSAASIGAFFGAVFVRCSRCDLSGARLGPGVGGHPRAPLGKEAVSATFLAVDQFVKKPGLEPGSSA